MISIVEEFLPHWHKWEKKYGRFFDTLNFFNLKLEVCNVIELACPCCLCWSVNTLSICSVNCLDHMPLVSIINSAIPQKFLWFRRVTWSFVTTMLFWRQTRSLSILCLHVELYHSTLRSYFCIIIIVESSLQSTINIHFFSNVLPITVRFASLIVVLLFRW